MPSRSAGVDPVRAQAGDAPNDGRWSGYDNRRDPGANGIAHGRQTPTATRSGAAISGVRPTGSEWP
jgi:hypothetical protein